MKEHRLAAWPELRGALDRTAYRRMLSDMSQRHMTVPQLVESSGLRRVEVQTFLDWLDERHLLISREHHGSKALDTMQWMLRWPGRTWRAAMRGD